MYEVFPFRWSFGFVFPMTSFLNPTNLSGLSLTVIRLSFSLKNENT